MYRFFCVFALLFFDSIRMVVNVVIGLYSAQKSSIVGELIVCVRVRHVSVLPKKVCTVWYWTELWSSVCFVQQQQKKSNWLTNWVLGVTFEIAFACEHVFYPIWSVAVWIEFHLAHNGDIRAPLLFTWTTVRRCSHYSLLNRLSKYSWFILNAIRNTMEH